jgi:hypothetical protein
MEIIKNEPLVGFTDNTAKTTVEDSFSEQQENATTETEVTDSQGSTSSRGVSLNSNEQEDTEFQESGYLSSSQTTENSPTDNCIDPELPTNPPPPQTNSPLLSTTDFPPLPKFLTTPTRRKKNTKQKPMRNKSISSQMSLDKFAFKKTRAMTEDSKTEAITTSPKRTVLAVRSPPNCELDGKYKGSQEDETGDENKKENYRNLSKHDQHEVEDTSYLTQEESKVIFLNSISSNNFGSHIVFSASGREC